MKDKELKKHNDLKWTLKDELEMLTTYELLEIQKLIVSFYDKEVKAPSATKKTQLKYINKLERNI